MPTNTDASWSISWLSRVKHDFTPISDWPVYQENISAQGKFRACYFALAMFSPPLTGICDFRNEMTFFFEAQKLEKPSRTRTKLNGFSGWQWHCTKRTSPPEPGTSQTTGSNALDHDRVWHAPCVTVQNSGSSERTRSFGGRGSRNRNDAVRSEPREQSHNLPLSSASLTIAWLRDASPEECALPLDKVRPSSRPPIDFTQYHATHPIGMTRTVAPVPSDAAEGRVRRV
jgi:hypothetical protein